MYFTLVAGELRLEYMHNTFNIEFEGSAVVISDYQIQNLIVVFRSITRSIDIEDFVIDDLTIQYNEAFICIGENFIMETVYIDDLLAMLNQAERMRLGLVRPPAPSGGTSVEATNLDCSSSTLLWGPNKNPYYVP